MLFLWSSPQSGRNTASSLLSYAPLLAIASYVALLVAMFASPYRAHAQAPPGYIEVVNFRTNWPPMLGATLTYLKSTQMYGAETAPAGSWVVFGGRRAGFNSTASVVNDNDVWMSSSGGTSWRVVSGGYINPLTSLRVDSASPSTSFTNFLGAASCVDPSSNRFYRFGGQTGTTSVTLLNTLFTSANGGLTWTQVTPTGITARSNASCVVVDSKLYVLAGYTSVTGATGTGSNDVWVSSDQGATFTRVTATAGFSPRASAMVTVQQRRKTVVGAAYLWLAGGQASSTAAQTNDVWYSSNAGVSWTAATAAASWTPRIGALLLSSEVGFLVIAGGRDNSGNLLNDIALSSRGSTWLQRTIYDVKPTAFYGASLSPRNGRLVIVGGLGLSGETTALLNDVVIASAGFDDDPESTLFMFGGSRAAQCLTFDSCRSSLTLTNTSAGVQGISPVLYRLPSAATYTRDTVTTTIPANSYVAFSGGGFLSTSASVWASSDGLNTWKAVADLPAAVVGLGARACVANGRFLLTGGLDNQNNDYVSTVYYSDDLGVSWTLLDQVSPFTGREGHNCVTDASGKAYIINGITQSKGESDMVSYLNDVWSTTDGASWSSVTSNTKYLPRGNAATIVFTQAQTYSNVFFVLGGESYDMYGNSTYLNDVYASTNMITWVRVTANAQWRARAGAFAAVHSSGALILMGGAANVTDGTGQLLYPLLSDVWVSLNGGYSWYLVQDAPFTGRRLASLYLVSNTLYMLGGAVAALTDYTYATDAWKSTATLPSRTEVAALSTDTPTAAAAASCYTLAAVCEGIMPAAVSADTSSDASSLVVAAGAPVAFASVLATLLVAILV